MLTYLFLMLVCASVQAAAAPLLSQPDWQAWVLRVEVVRTDGMQEMGSAAIVAPGRLITNCHVLREARRITVSRRAMLWPARIGTGSAYRDLCFLDVPECSEEADNPGLDDTGSGTSGAGAAGARMGSRLAHGAGR